MIKRLLLSSLLLLLNMAGLHAQGTAILIGPATNNGGFEDATPGPWTLVNGTRVNKWVIDGGATQGFTGAKAAYVSNGTTTPYPHTYDFSSSTSVFLYQDVTFPAGYSGGATLTFSAIQTGENNFDQALVYISTGTPGTAPTAGTVSGSISSLPVLSGYQQLTIVPVQSPATWTTYTVNIPASQIGNSATTSSTRRIMFRWVSGSNSGSNPPIGIDNVSLTANCSGPLVTVSGITASSATLSWPPITGSTSYQIRYRLATDPTTVPTWATPTLTSSTTYTLNGLVNNSSYIYEVASVDGSCTTPATGTFSTLCMLATIPYTENFEGIVANNTLPMCMAGITLGSNVLSYTSNQTSLNRINHTPGGSKFVSFAAVAAPRYLFTPAFELDSAKTYRLSFWYIANNATGLDTVRAVLSNSQTAADITVYAAPITDVKNTLYQQYYADIKPTFSGIQYFGISVKGVVSGSQFLTVDDLNIIELTPCLGTPTVTAPTGPASICANQPFTVTANGYNSVSSGFTFQWQSSTSCTGTWYNIPGATSPNYTVANGIIIPQAYRVIVTCTNSGQSVISPCLAVALTPFYNCGCTSAATSTLNEDIAQVAIGSFFTNPAVSPIPPLTNNPLANATYTDYTNLAPIPLVKGTNYPLNISQFSSGSIAATVVKGFIDYNHNALFTDPDEPIDTITSPANNAAVPSHTGDFTVPTTAQVGITKLRFVLSRAAANSVVPCNTYATGETEDYLVEISGKPAPPQVINNGPVCGGDTVVVTATSNILTSNPSNIPQYTLTGPGIGSLTNTTGVFRIPTPRTVSSAQYVATVQAYGQTSDTSSTTVTIYPNPNITVGPVVNPTTCLSTDGSITIQNLGNTLTYTLQYLRNGVLVTVAGITPNASGNYVISNLDAAFYDKITIVNTNGCVPKVVGPVSLVAPAAPPTPNASANTPVCLGSTLTLTVSSPNPAGSYNWFGPNNFIATGTTVTRANMSYADTGDYYVTINIAGCKSAPRKVRVDITAPSAAPTTTNPQQFCQFSTGQNLVAFGANLLFYPNATGGTGTATLAPNTTVVGTFTYYVTQNTTGCPSAPRTPITVVVVPQPTAPLVPYDTVKYCQLDNPVALLAYGPNQRYYTTPTGGFGTASITPSTANPGITIYYATQTINGCEGPRKPIVVIVKPKPALPTVTSPINVCQFSAPQPLTAQGQNLLWYDVPTGGTGLTTPPSPPTGREATLNYYVVQSIDGCESDRAVIEVNVNYLPNANFVPSKNYVCVADTISFVYFGNARPTAQYNWTVPPSAQIVSGQNTQGPLVVRFNDTGSYEVRLVVDNKGCLSGAVYQSFEVRPRPEVRINAKRELCIGEVTEVTLDSLSENISNFSWSFGDGEVVYGTQSTGPYGIRWSTPGTKTIFVNTVSRQCGSFPRGETFTVRPTPAAAILNKPTAPFCSSDSIRLQAADLGPGYAYQWSPAEFFRSFERAGTTVWAVVETANATSTNITLTVTDTLGCKGTDNATITTVPCCGVTLPTAFTPNGDGTNDVFGIIRSGGNPQVSAFRIFNRLGNVVFETANSQKGWDGTFVGDPQPMEVYYYYVKYRCAGKEYETKGEVTLIR